MDQSQEIQWASLWKHSKGSIYQNWNWLKIHEDSQEKLNIYTIEVDGKLVAGIGGFEKTLTTPLGKKKILQFHGDPIYSDINYCEDLIKKIKLASKQFFYATISHTSKEVYEILERNGFSKSVNSTSLINLNSDKDSLWSQLEKKSIRWGIKTAEKNNLIFSQASSSSDIDSFYSLYAKTAKDGGFKAESKELIISLIKSGLTNLFIVKNKSELVAGGMVINDSNRNTAILEMTSASEEGLDLQAMPFLYWNLILHFKSKGHSVFDLGGYDQDAKPGEKTYNINKFKERFAGNITEIPVHSSNSKYTLVRSLMRNFRFIKKLYRKN